MQPNTDQLLKTYKAADYERRMFLFLEYRDLRELFTEIDAHELAIECRFLESRKRMTWLKRLKQLTVMKGSPRCSSVPPAGR